MMMQPSLYEAQRNAYRAVEGGILALNRTTYRDSFYHFSYDAYSFISHVIEKTQEIARLLFTYLSDFFSQYFPHADFSSFCDSAIYNFFYPLNPIDNKRHFSLLPVGLEERISSYLLLSLGFGISSTSPIEVEKGELKEGNAFINHIISTIAEANKFLLNTFFYHGNVVSGSILNAFAIPGGEIVVFKELLSEIANTFTIEDSRIQSTSIAMADGSIVTIDVSDVTFTDVCAALLAHEMTHIASRHSAFALGLDLLIALFINALPNFLENIANFLAFLFEQYRSRENEYEADITGAFLIGQAGYNPKGALYLQEFFKTVSHPLLVWALEYAEPISTHPSYNSRLLALFSGIASFAPETLTYKILDWKNKIITAKDNDGIAWHYDDNEPHTEALKRTIELEEQFFPPNNSSWISLFVHRPVPSADSIYKATMANPHNLVASLRQRKHLITSQPA